MKQAISLVWLLGHRQKSLQISVAGLQGNSQSLQWSYQETSSLCNGVTRKQGGLCSGATRKETDSIVGLIGNRRSLQLDYYEQGLLGKRSLFSWAAKKRQFLQQSYYDTCSLLSGTTRKYTVSIVGQLGQGLGNRQSKLENRQSSLVGLPGNRQPLHWGYQEKDRSHSQVLKKQAVSIIGLIRNRHSLKLGYQETGSLFSGTTRRQAVSVVVRLRTSSLYIGSGVSKKQAVSLQYGYQETVCSEATRECSIGMRH